ncbi:hypothetical protein SAMN05216324_1367 [Chryseobacterium limigenitum]|uniref:Uncharacterized protein n=1 Tax=Chryseobacterium limigenitum TaxID=1612149 RepID=A0A1K2IZ38_9FLAO|nr:hypothetical protein SAMN05216324_1367 [Chryseobacterium limigenitum]
MIAREFHHKFFHTPFKCLITTQKILNKKFSEANCILILPRFATFKSRVFGRLMKGIYQFSEAI